MTGEVCPLAETALVAARKRPPLPRRIPRILTIGLKEISLLEAQGQFVSMCEGLWMSVSTVSPPPIAIVVPSYDTTKQQDDQIRTKDNDPTYKPPPPAPLPPGQGTRIDQLA